MSAPFARCEPQPGNLAPLGLAAGAAEALRAVNHLTMATPTKGTVGWEGVGDVYRLVGELSLLVDRLPQALDQITLALRYAENDGRLRGDDCAFDSVEGLVAGSVRALGCAGREARRMGVTLDEAHQRIAHLYERPRS